MDWGQCGPVSRYPRLGRAVWALAMEKERKLLGRVGVAFWLLGEQSDPAQSYG